MKKVIKLLSTSLLLSVAFSHISHGADPEEEGEIPKPVLTGKEARKATASTPAPKTPTKSREKAPEPAVTPKKDATSAPTTPAKAVKSPAKRVTSSPVPSPSPIKGAARPDLTHDQYPETGRGSYAIHRYKGTWVPTWIHDKKNLTSGPKSTEYAAWRVKVLEYFLKNKRPSVADKPINEIAGAYVHLELQATQDVNLWTNGMDTGTFGGADTPTPKLPYIFQYAAQHNHFGVVMTISEKLTSEMLRNESSRWGDRFQTALSSAAFFNNVKALKGLTETRLNVAGFDSLYNAFASAIHPRTDNLPSFDAIEYILIDQISRIEVNNKDGLGTAQRILNQLAEMYAKKNVKIQANRTLEKGVHDRANEIAAIIAATQGSTDNKLTQ